jgi:hypothetical protein
MVCYKQILRQESGVVLIEISFRAGPNGGLESATYSLSSKRSSKIMSFDNLTAAVACFEAELTHYDRSPRLAMGGARFTA